MVDGDTNGKFTLSDCKNGPLLPPTSAVEEQSTIWHPWRSFMTVGGQVLVKLKVDIGSLMRL